MIGVCCALHVNIQKIAAQAIFYLANSESSPDNRDFCGTAGAKIHKCNRLLVTGIIFLFLSACSNPVGSESPYYQVVYIGNGNTEGTPPLSVQVISGTGITVAVNSGGLAKAEHHFTGWNTKSDGSGTPYKPGNVVSLKSDMDLYAQWQPGTADKTFYATTTDNTWYMVDAEKLAENARCIVYGDVSENISPQTAQAIADEYANQIYPKITGAFGEIAYMPPGNGGKLFLFLLDIIDGASGSGGYVAGYFDSTHMFNFTYSNQAAMLFMDVYPGDPTETKDFCTVIAHELQHLIHFSATGLSQSGIPSKNLWINEGLSLAAEYIYGGEQASRINYFNGKFGETTIPYGNNFFIWDGYWEQQYGDVLADYATAYLFFRWLGIRAAGTADIYKDIILAPHADSQAVTGAAAAIDPHFSEWKTLLAAWMLANYYQQKTGVYGYGTGFPSLTKWVVVNSAATQPYFFPGEGVFSSISSSVAPSYPAGNIHYIGLPTGSPPSGSLLGSGPYTGEALLTFNGNTSESGDGEQGYVASREPAAGMSRNVANRNVGPLAAPPGNYPVDFRDMAKKSRGGAGIR
jgi:hypothetical protein